MAVVQGCACVNVILKNIREAKYATRAEKDAFSQPTGEFFHRKENNLALKIL